MAQPVPRRTGLIVGLIGAGLVVLALIAGAFLIGRRSNTKTTSTKDATSSSVAGSNSGTTRPTTAGSSSKRSTTVLGTRSPNSAGSSNKSVPSVGGLKKITRAELPPEAITTLGLIEKGPPFPYKQDGVVFQNREGILPKKSSGYYHEYTVKTPGASNRGTRRIIVGGDGEMMYTDDHYASFKQIVPE